MVVSRVIVFSDGWRRSGAAQPPLGLDQDDAARHCLDLGVGRLEDGRGPLGAASSDCSRGWGRPGSASYAGTPDRSACSDGISDHSEGIPHAMAANGPINAPIAVVWTTPRGLTASQSAVSPAAAAHMTIIRR